MNPKWSMMTINHPHKCIIMIKIGHLLFGNSTGLIVSQTNSEYENMFINICHAFEIVKVSKKKTVRLFFNISKSSNSIFVPNHQIRLLLWFLWRIKTRFLSNYYLDKYMKMKTLYRIFGVSYVKSILNEIDCSEEDDKRQWKMKENLVKAHHIHILVFNKFVNCTLSVFWNSENMQIKRIKWQRHRICMYRLYI